MTQKDGYGSAPTARGTGPDQTGPDQTGAAQGRATGFSEADPLTGQFSIFPRCRVLTRVDPETNMHRYYAMRVDPDLLEGACLVIEPVS